MTTMRFDLLLVLPVADLLAPIPAIVFGIHLKRRRNWPLWVAYGTGAAAYLVWAYTVALAIGFGPSEWILTKVGVVTAGRLGFWRIPFDHPAEGLLLLFAPTATLLLCPTFALWVLARARGDKVATASPSRSDMS